MVGGVAIGSVVAVGSVLWVSRVFDNDLSTSLTLFKGVFRQLRGYERGRALLEQRYFGLSGHV